MVEATKCESEISNQNDDAPDADLTLERVGRLGETGPRAANHCDPKPKNLSQLVRVPTSPAS
jgi:hypothetical protein